MISLICKQYGITNYTINSDGSIDVNGYVNLSYRHLTELPLMFNRVTGLFNCSYNQLTSLEFSPDYVGGDFDCEYNNLTNNYCDTEILGDFYTTLVQDGLIINEFNITTNYNEWRKLYKRKMILDDIFNM